MSVPEENGRPAKKAKSSKSVPLAIKLELEPEEKSLITFELNTIPVEADPDSTVNDLSSIVEEKFATLTEEKGDPLEMTVIAFDTARHREAGQIIMYGKEVGETFQPGEEVIVVCEVRPAGSLPADGPEPLSDDEKIPCTVITGFLGAGKTTLLNHILTEQHGRRIAVLENEFGAMSIDDKLLSAKLTGAEQIVVADNGCICCTVRGDLVDMIGQVLDRNDTLPKEKQIEAILIETTGMADPSPVLQTFVASQRCMEHCVVDGVITVVDTRNVLQHLKADKERVDAEVNESVLQIAFADRIILNKMDLVNSQEAQEVVREVRKINRASKVIRSVNSQVDVNSIIGIRSFDLSKIVSEIDPDFKEATKDEQGDDDKEGHHHHDHDHEHADGHKCGDKCDHDHSHGKKHRHDQRVSSVGVEVEGEIDPDDLDEWWRVLMEKKAKSIYRSKGIIAMKGQPTKMVFQAVHELLRFEGLDPWKPDEPRTNKMVFIGVDLDKDELTENFKKLVQ
eukprot:m.169067 g.169067  ORF g.169067 m.169067 type:complete len:508 (+) comp13048_c0_seq1:75-1598(+)